jgi:hypothetical protein
MSEVPLGPTQTPKTNTFRERLSSAASSAASQVRGAVLKGLGAPTEPQYNEMVAQLKELVKYNFGHDNYNFDEQTYSKKIGDLIQDSLLIGAASKLFQKRLEYLKRSNSTNRIAGVEFNIEYANRIKSIIDEKLKKLKPDLFDESGNLKVPSNSKQSNSNSSGSSLDYANIYWTLDNIDSKALLEVFGHILSNVGHVAASMATSAITGKGGKKRNKRSIRSTKKLNKSKAKTHKRKEKSRKNKKSKSRKNK